MLALTNAAIYVSIVRVTVNQEHDLLFKHAHGKQQLAQSLRDVETYYRNDNYHRHKRRKRKLLQLVVLALLESEDSPQGGIAG